MEIKSLILSPLQTNCYFVINSKECIIIDPAINANKILSYAKDNDLEIKALLLTHGHFDHCSAVKDLQNLGYKVYASEFNSYEIKTNPKYFGLTERKSFKVDFIVKDNEVLNLIGLKIKIITTPGHTEGCVSYLIENSLFCGDTIFAGGNYGRCDLYSGDFEKIKHSIKHKLFKLNNDVKVFPGHGESSTIGKEKQLLTDF